MRTSHLSGSHMGSSKYSEKSNKTDQLPTIGERTKVNLHNICRKLWIIGTSKIQQWLILLLANCKRNKKEKIKRKNLHPKRK